ncbi:mitochondrial ribosome-associated GTPase 2 isoform X1 [Anolis sagrei]|uniref:mitochondrial ribosome-associated GTPase 2 isoform X1 n=2 Tax=Anolis sagrei TaxID=38937 RepID=UPI00295B236A|nr:mitochondrial ribosome-associated GTPase 2 isoform X2 [Anolis sagrei ordinatus]
MKKAEMMRITIRAWLESQWIWADSHQRCSLFPQKVKSWHKNLSTTCSICSKSKRLERKRNLSEKKLSRCFVDHRKVRLTAGKGGDGISCFHSEPRKMYGGPDGGDGGDGGHIILKVDQQVKSLASLLPLYRGFDGEKGGSKNCYGAAGKSIYLKVPIGTVVKEDNEIIADLNQHGEEYVAVYGGTGGKGNRFFLANDNRAPETATEGEPGEEKVLSLELKTMAHAGLVGFPNAGKSSLLRAISNAKPAVASYPFTTLNPHVGIVHYEGYEQVAVADVPGIIKGAHQNRGLGLAFLKHIERCRFLLYVLDLSVPEPWTQLRDLKYELEQYEQGLSKRPHAIIGNKFDLPQAKSNLPLLKEQVEQRVIPLSALTGDNLEELLLHLKDLYDHYVKTEERQSCKPMKW